MSLTFDLQSFWSQLAPLLEKYKKNKSIKITVGFSGGLDSTVLLHALSQLESDKKDFQLSAFHINHQLQKNSDSWECFCQQFCEKYSIDFHSARVIIDNDNNSGTEAAARDARYNAFHEHLGEQELLLTAHHLDDHIETVFLKLLRGTGVEGARGILPLSNFKNLNIVRPLLVFDRDSLLSYAEKQGLTWVDDPSNALDQYDRNYLRHKILPLIEQRWPGYKRTINRFTQNVTDVNNVIHESVRKDYTKAFNENDTSLDLLALSELTVERQRLLLRFWIKKLGYKMPNQKHIQQILNVINARHDANPQVCWDDVQIRRYQGKLFLFRSDHTFIMQEYHWDLLEPLHIPGVGTLDVLFVVGGGIKKDYFQQGVHVKFRMGGEVCRPHKRSYTHTLKKLLQEKAIPPWQREKLPLIVIHNEIAAVLGEFYCDPFCATENEQGFEIIKRP